MTKLEILFVTGFTLLFTPFYTIPLFARQFVVWRRKPFKTAICRAYNDGLINSYQMHELAARMDAPSKERIKPKGGYQWAMGHATLFALALGIAFGASGCTSALNSGHIVSVTERGFGIDIITTSTANGTPQIKLGFFSSAVVLEPVATNAVLTAPNFANTFAIDQTASPFAFGVNETIASGSYQTGNVMSTNTAIASQPVVPK